MPVRKGTETDLPASLIRRIYDAAFFSEIARQFKFDTENPETIAAINRMGISYLISRQLEDWHDPVDQRKRLKKLESEIHRFLATLEKSQDLEIPQLMYFSALKSGQPRPQTNFPSLTAHQQTQSGEPYARELLRLLTILENGIADAAKMAAPKRGPKPNLGLESLAFQAAEFFASQNRPFTIDAHKPFQATEAFDFVKMLVQPLDDISDDNIVTAIRGAKVKIQKS